jgi:predicted NUDIX family NTP pyrophosphohydrolase
MTGGPWHVSDDPDDKWAISQDEIDDIESPLTLNAREFLELAVELGFPNDDDRYRRLVRAFGGGERA